jgi:DNA-binding XRE family transcriptional regulator/quercetin dioxygenase-like cupin family protein
MSNIVHSQPPDVLTHLSDNLRRMRQERNLSQGALAARSGLSRRMISAIEGGAANVSLSTVDRLAEALSARFTDLVRSPGSPDARRIQSVGWKGDGAGSQGELLGAAPGSHETELWRWSLAPGERYLSEAGSEGWHEMLYVLEGTLTLELPNLVHRIGAGDFLIFSTDQSYGFVNETSGLIRYIRNIVL